MTLLERVVFLGFFCVWLACTYEGCVAYFRNTSDPTTTNERIVP